MKRAGSRNFAKDLAKAVSGPIRAKGAASENHWPTTRLGELIKIQNGYAFSSKLFNASEGMPLVRIRSLKSGVENETFFNGTFDNQYLVHAGDLLIGMDGEFGCYEWKGPASLLNQRVCRLQDFDNSLLPRFLYYGINSHLKAIESATGYTTVKHLSSSTVLNIEFAVPPLAEQQRIVRLLDEAFEGIAIAKANAEKNLQNVRVLFESHLHAVFTQGGSDWVRRKLSDLVEVQNGYAFSSKDYSDSGHFLMRIGNVQNGFITTSNPKYVRLLTDDPLQRFNLAAGDVLVSLTGNVGRVGVITQEHLPAVLNQRVAKISFRQDSPMLRSLVLHFLSSELFRSTLSHVGHGTAQQNVSATDLVKIAIPIPDEVRQQVVVRMLDDLRKFTHALARTYLGKLAALDELENSLLHQVFSGDLKVA